jgi:maleylacetoacetate isomerase
MTDRQTRFENYSFWRSSATYRVRVALALKGLKAEEHDIDLDRGEQRDPKFLAVNPMGAVPALIDHAPGASNTPITQSIAILEFLDEIAPTPPLLPSDPHGRARVRSLASMLTSDTHPLVVPRIKKYLMANGFDDASWRKWQINWFTTGLQAFEQRLVHEGIAGGYCHGDSVTMADICMASIVVVTRVFKIDVPDIPTVNGIMTRCEDQPAFAGADPRVQSGAPAS